MIEMYWLWVFGVAFFVGGAVIIIMTRERYLNLLPSWVLIPAIVLAPGVVVGGTLLVVGVLGHVSPREIPDRTGTVRMVVSASHPVMNDGEVQVWVSRWVRPAVCAQMKELEANSQSPHGPANDEPWIRVECSR